MAAVGVGKDSVKLSAKNSQIVPRFINNKVGQGKPDASVAGDNLVENCGKNLKGG